MIDKRCLVAELNNADLLAGTRELVRRSRENDTDLLIYLGEIDERRLYAERACSSMHEFCLREFGFSDDVAYSRVTVARAARRLPGIIEVLRAGRVHLTGVRLLIPHLTLENHRELLASAAGKTKGEIEELVVSFAPRPPVPDMIRKVPQQAQRTSPEADTTVGTASSKQPTLPLDPVDVGNKTPGGTEPASAASPSDAESAAAASPSDAESAAASPPGASESAPAVPAVARQKKGAPAVIAPLAPDAFKFQFTGSRALRDKIREARTLLRRRVQNGDLATIVEMAMDLLIQHVKKERFAVGRKPRRSQLHRLQDIPVAGSRHVPNEYKRIVYERDEGRCTARDENGRRCESTDVEFDHIDGWALEPVHSIDRLRLLCRAHNQHAADKMYGREFMKRARARKRSARSGTSSEPHAAPEPSNPKKGSEERLL